MGNLCPLMDALWCPLYKAFFYCYYFCNYTRRPPSPDSSPKAFPLGLDPALTLPTSRSRLGKLREEEEVEKKEGKEKMKKNAEEEENTEKREELRKGRKRKRRNQRQMRPGNTGGKGGRRDGLKRRKRMGKKKTGRRIKIEKL